MMRINHKYCAHLIVLALIIVSLSACNSTGSGSGIQKGSLLKLDKPLIDTALVLDNFDLYRSKRFEGIDEAINEGQERVYKLVLWV